MAGDWAGALLTSGCGASLEDCETTELVEEYEDERECLFRE